MTASYCENGSNRNFININRDQIYVTREREYLANQICIIEILQCYLCWVKVSSNMRYS